MPTSPRVPRLLTAAAVTAALVFVAAPAQAAKAPVRTAITAHLLPATALVKSVAVVSGTVKPAGGTLVLQRLVGKAWKPVASKKSTAAGNFTFSVRAPKAATTWPLRVTRAATKTTKAGVSPTVKLRVVPTAFLVAAAATGEVTAPGSITVTGSVAPKQSGSVQVQRKVGATWVTVTTARLSASSTFSAVTAQPPGAVQLRVVRPYTATVATGTSPALTATVRPAPPVPGTLAISTVALQQARVGRLFYAALSATGGTGGYTWSATGLPAGLTLSALGALVGTPTAGGTVSFTATVVDAAGKAASSALTLTVARQQGHLVAWGDNADGELGNGTGTDAFTIVPVSGMDAVVSAHGGGSDAAAVLADGTVWTWGYGGNGQLGTGGMTSSTTPTRAVGLTDVTGVAAGAATLAVRADGTVWGWGSNAYGEIGDGTTTDRLVPTQVPGLSSVVSVTEGLRSSYALRSDGTVWAWGDNALGQLGSGSTTTSPTPHQVSGLSGVTAVSAGYYFALALRSDGTVWAWGSNAEGELGDGTTTQRNLPVQATGVAAVRAISTGGTTSYAVLAASVVAWGGSTYGQLGNGSTANSPTPVSVSNLTVVSSVVGTAIGAYALLPDGTVKGWGHNTNGSVGDGTTTTRTQPVPVLGLTGAIAIGGDAQSTSGYAVVAD